MINASRDQTEHVDRARLVESCGARDDSPSWNLGREKQGNTIRVNGMGSQARGRKEVRKWDQVQGQDVERDAQLADPAVRGGCGKMQDQGERRECDETSRHR